MWHHILTSNAELTYLTFQVGTKVLHTVTVIWNVPLNACFALSSVASSCALLLIASSCLQPYYHEKYLLSEESGVNLCSLMMFHYT